MSPSLQYGSNELQRRSRALVGRGQHPKLLLTSVRLRHYMYHDAAILRRFVFIVCLAELLQVWLNNLGERVCVTFAQGVVALLLLLARHRRGSLLCPDSVSPLVVVVARPILFALLNLQSTQIDDDKEANLLRRSIDFVMQHKASGSIKILKS